jgi:hypothetical protein
MKIGSFLLQRQKSKFGSFLTFVGYNFSAPSMAFLKDGIIYLKIGVNLYLLGYSVFTLAYARPPCRPKTYPRQLWRGFFYSVEWNAR